MVWPEEKFKGLLPNNLKVVMLVPACDDLANTPKRVIKKAKSYGAYLYGASLDNRTME